MKLTAASTEIHKELIEGSKTGDTKAQYQLYQLYSKAMFNVCLRMMKTREEAEDMLQESFTTAFRRLNSFRYESTFGAWIKRIVVNHCINEIKRKKTELVLEEEPEKLIEEKTEEATDFTDDLLNVEKIKMALSKLSEGYRVIFSLYLLEGYDHQEIGEILKISTSTSKSQYHRAKEKIKELLIQERYERG